MSENNQRRWVAPSVIVAAAVAAAIVCVLSYLGNQSQMASLASISQIDLFKGDSADNWVAYGGLSASDVHFKRTDNDVVEVDLLGYSQLHPKQWSHESPGLRYALGFLAPGWYEFAGEFQAETDDSRGIGAQLDIQSGRWRYSTKSDAMPVDRRKTFDIFFRPSDAAPGAEISCRFFGRGGNRSRKAFFRNLRLVKIAGEPPPTATKFDVETSEIARIGLPPNPRYPSFRGLGVIVLLLAMIAGVCWRLLE
jgi:hypothetical protein